MVLYVWIIEPLSKLEIFRTFHVKKGGRGFGGGKKIEDKEGHKILCAWGWRHNVVINEKFFVTPVRMEMKEKFGNYELRGGNCGNIFSGSKIFQADVIIYQSVLPHLSKICNTCSYNYSEGMHILKNLMDRIWIMIQWNVYTTIEFHWYRNLLRPEDQFEILTFLRYAKYNS